MVSFTNAALLALTAGLAKATYPNYEVIVGFFEDSTCAGSKSASDPKYSPQLLPSINGGCEQGYASEPSWPMVSKDSTSRVGYFNPNSLPAGCSMGILKPAAVAPSACGAATDVIKYSTEASCVQVNLPENYGISMCCGGQGAGCNTIPGSNKRALPQRRAAANNNTTQVRDVTQIKRAPILDLLRRTTKCHFETTRGPFKNRGLQQIVSAGLACPASQSGGSCSISNTYSLTTGSSNSFGVSESTTVGGDDLFMDIQETVGFSYMYTYSESKSVSEMYTVNVPAGESGHLTWTPTVSCVSGTVSEECSVTNKVGQACIPLYIGGGSKGSPSGTFGFLESQ